MFFIYKKEHPILSLRPWRLCESKLILYSSSRFATTDISSSITVTASSIGLQQTEQSSI